MCSMTFLRKSHKYRINKSYVQAPTSAKGFLQASLCTVSRTLVEKARLNVCAWVFAAQMSLSESQSHGGVVLMGMLW